MHQEEIDQHSFIPLRECSQPQGWQMLFTNGCQDQRHLCKHIKSNFQLD